MVKRDVVIGFDPASVAGWAVFALNGRLLESGAWTIRRGDFTGDRWIDLHGRLVELFERYRGRVAAVVIERPVVYRGIQWDTLRVLFGQAALVDLIASRHCADSVFVPPATLKKHVAGNGRASKAEVIDAVVRATGPLSTEAGGETEAERARRDKARSDEADARATVLWLLDVYDRADLAMGILARLAE